MLPTYEPRVSWQRWVLAGCVALAVHVALFAKLGQRDLRVPTEQVMAAQAIELDEPGAGETASLAPSQAEPPKSAQPDAEANAPTVNDRPDAPAADVPTPQPAPTVEAPAVPAPSAIAIAPVRPAAKKPPAPRTAKATPAARPAKPSPARPLTRPGASMARGSAAVGAAAGSSLSVSDWNSLVAAQIRRNQRYPDGARSRGEAGVATIAFSVARSGAIGTARLAASSGHADLDAEALAAVRRSNPLPPPPSTIAAPVARNVPIRFDLR